jgi:hypothetical protein
LCQRYWFPLFAYVRQLGHDVHQAQDLTQGFFERLAQASMASLPQRQRAIEQLNTAFPVLATLPGWKMMR